MNVLTTVHVNPVSTDTHRKSVLKEILTKRWTGYIHILKLGKIYWIEPCHQTCRDICIWDMKFVW